MTRTAIAHSDAKPDHDATSIRGATAGWILAVAATGTGLLLSTTAPAMPGSQPLSSEDLVDAAAAILLGGLGLVLVLRRVATKLGYALVATAAVDGSVWLTAGIADALAGGHSDPPALPRALAMMSGALFITGFALLVLSPLLLFPTGHLPSQRWRPVAWLAIGATGASVLSLLFQPGPVDDDVPAWGANPLGIPAAQPVWNTLQIGGLIGLATALILAVAAVAARLLLLRGAPRRQTIWFAAMMAPVLAAFILDANHQLPSTASAVIVFALLLTAIGYPLLRIRRTGPNPRDK